MVSECVCLDTGPLTLCFLSDGPVKYKMKFQTKHKFHLNNIFLLLMSCKFTFRGQAALFNTVVNENNPSVNLCTIVREIVNSIPMMPQPSESRSQESKTGQAVWVRGMLLLSPPSITVTLVNRGRL